ncbi:MAG: TIGR01777 family oxidoreductase [Verrucomicrobiales bacterium]|nr:TIGR01777 family oxidoreductase [Verrucomicrobiales bacterium]
MKKRIVLAGGSGFLGFALANRLTTLDYETVILSRNPHGYKGPGRAVFWDGKTIDDTWLKEIDGAEAVINLTGKNVNCRPTRANREAILASRVDSVAVLGEAVRMVANYPKVWIQAGSLAIYGDAGERVCNEAAMVASGYPANVCVDWETELGKAIRPEMRWVNLRIGFVLGTEGGALPFLTQLTKWGLGGAIGNGHQYISWIHIEDMLRIFVTAVEDPETEGTYNATGPAPVTNREFMATLRRVLRRPWSPPGPEFAVRLGAPLLNSDPEIALSGRRCIPEKLEQEGFSFCYNNLKTALENIYTK